MAGLDDARKPGEAARWRFALATLGIERFAPVLTRAGLPTDVVGPNLHALAQRAWKEYGAEARARDHQAAVQHAVSVLRAGLGDRADPVLSWILRHYVRDEQAVSLEHWAFVLRRLAGLLQPDKPLADLDPDLREPLERAAADAFADRNADRLAMKAVEQPSGAFESEIRSQASEVAEPLGAMLRAGFDHERAYRALSAVLDAHPEARDRILDWGRRQAALLGLEADRILLPTR